MIAIIFIEALTVLVFVWCNALNDEGGNIIQIIAKEAYHEFVNQSKTQEQGVRLAWVTLKH